MSEFARKVQGGADHRLLAKPSKTPLAFSASSKHQGLVKKERELASPTKISSNSLPKTSFHSPNNSKLAASVGKASSSKGTSQKSSSRYESDKKEKKVYQLPGQKHDPPEERDPLRIFYESLYRQNPKSEMAQIWMMEHGLLSPEAAKKALDRKKRSLSNQKMGIPVKPSFKSGTVKSEKVVTKSMVVTPERKVFTSNGDSKGLTKVKRKLELDSDSDDDRPLKPKKKLSTSA
eukprot:c8151_g1_i1 orf=399-1097(-)